MPYKSRGSLDFWRPYWLSSTPLFYNHAPVISRAYQTTVSTQDSLLVDAAVYAIADQYLIDPLPSSAEAEFARQLEES
jgi:hypothetical protein